MRSSKLKPESAELTVKKSFGGEDTASAFPMPIPKIEQGNWVYDVSPEQIAGKGGKGGTASGIPGKVM